MPQSLSNVYLHVIFSTKQRLALIPKSIRADLYSYISGICQNQGCPAQRVGGTEDHIHIACSLSRTLAISKLIEEIKTGSSSFSWQSGYGVFSVGEADLPRVVDYIDNQEEHHRRKTFQDELREILSENKIAYDERWLWD